MIALLSLMNHPLVKELLHDVPFERLQLLVPLQGRKSSELTPDDLRLIGEVLDFKVDVTSELRDAAVALLQSRSIDKVSDLIRSPESLHQLVSFLKGGLKTLRITNAEGTRVRNAVKRPGVYDCATCKLVSIIHEVDGRLTPSECPGCATVIN